MTMQEGEQSPPVSDGAGLCTPPPNISIASQPDEATATRQVGRTSLGLKVERVQDSEPRHPATTLFLASLASDYGERITATVASELGLDDSTASVPAAVAEQATRMAQTQMDVFDGANFFIELHCSATARGAGFLSACQRAGVTPAALDACALDVRFRALLAQATHGNQAPLAPLDGERLLEHLLRDDAQAAGGA
jgi:hypothetical protein